MFASRSVDGEDPGGAQSSVTAAVRSRDGMAALAALVALFSKVGKELLLEGQRDMLILRTLNDAKTAFAAVELQRGVFFHEYGLEPASRPAAARDQGSQTEEEPFLGKVLLKSLGPVLRNVKKMKYLCIRDQCVDGVVHELVFEMACEYGIQRTHRLAYQECVALSAVFDDNGASQLSVDIVVFKQLLEQVDHSSQIELIASRDSFQVRSFHQALSGGVPLQRHMTTEMSIPTREFLHYRYCSQEQSEEMVMSIKELKSIIAFCEAMEIAAFSIFFYGGGRPCKLSCEHESFIVALVVATLEPPGRVAGRNGNIEDESAPGDATLSRRFRHNEGNEDSTVRRLAVASHDGESWSQPTNIDNRVGRGSDHGTSSTGSQHSVAGGNIGVDHVEYVGGKDADEADWDVSTIHAAANSSAHVLDTSLDMSGSGGKNLKRARYNEGVVSGPMSVSGDSDAVPGPSRAAFSRSSLKRLIDSDSDDDFDELRNL